MYISVVGASECDAEGADIAYRVGWEIARRGHILVCGGLSGVMDAAAHGAHDAGGPSLGILPQADRSRASRWLTASIPTDMGHGRNALVALAGDAVIAVRGGYGTLSEVALALKMGKPVIGIDSWNPDPDSRDTGKVVQAPGPEEAVRLAEELALRPEAHRPDSGVS
ncbi:MAG: TIGR00725 family protein [Actinobacteria bacterium]|nr:TIGR00725 family protein [Actinomycetota bacterium]MBU1944777.1 TIGR00725 family protein [Actinomycetota bacterium]MBU2688868.1 TIGR00725 family protein [Actinomycetota bacterium]